MVPSDLLCGGPRRLSPLKKPAGPLQMSLVFTPQVLAFTSLSPPLFITSPPSPGHLWCLGPALAASPSLCVAHMRDSSLGPRG